MLQRSYIISPRDRLAIVWLAIVFHHRYSTRLLPLMRSNRDHLHDLHQYQSCEKFLDGIYMTMF